MELTNIVSWVEGAATVVVSDVEQGAEDAYSLFTSIDPNLAPDLAAAGKFVEQEFTTEAGLFAQASYNAVKALVAATIQKNAAGFGTDFVGTTKLVLEAVLAAIPGIVTTQGKAALGTLVGAMIAAAVAA
jgi:hypothetical protein